MALSTSNLAKCYLCYYDVILKILVQNHGQLTVKLLSARDHVTDSSGLAQV